MDWHLLILALPSAQATARMRVWRGLRARGCAVLRDGVYLLPQKAGLREFLVEQAAEVTAAGGGAQVLDVQADAAQAGAFRQLFDRANDYAAWSRQTTARAAELEAKSPGAAARELAKRARELARIEAIDYFPGAERARARALLARLEAAVEGAAGEPRALGGAIEARRRADYRARLWATRRRPWIDRLASAWLIRRHIDPEARFLWLAAPADLAAGAVGFDFDGAEFTHVGNRVTFEVLAASFGLEREPVLARLAQLVHYLDVGGVPSPEAPGLEAMLRGARERHADDDALLGEALVIFDALAGGLAAALARQEENDA
ncbi:chromate resistance protein [Ectothiorhodospiraceae bacterium 2226]|nr:chromate resistance protein [Ectothiorhodospiraceae bacterium 2226]